MVCQVLFHEVENVSRQDSVDISWDLWQTLEICQNRIQATETTNINLLEKQTVLGETFIITDTSTDNTMLNSSLSLIIKTWSKQGKRKCPGGGKGM